MIAPCKHRIKTQLVAVVVVVITCAVLSFDALPTIVDDLKSLICPEGPIPEISKWP